MFVKKNNLLSMKTKKNYKSTLLLLGGFFLLASCLNSD